ncbi:MAG TPA: STAS/SEC14 domain-containing protein [Casimicrobiaceae bacterium]|jgi:SpoIIAA-like|nr:STAS/SEC14 domain-containing protein [Casimicrobiaceae bacterium]
MLAYHLNPETGIVELRPRGPLEAQDFTSLWLTMKSYIEDHGRLRGLLLELDRFPGFDDWDAIAAQIRFVRRNLPKVDRIALLTDNPWLEPLPDVLRLLTPLEVKRFPLERRGDAFAWIVSQRAH